MQNHILTLIIALAFLSCQEEKAPSVERLRPVRYEVVNPSGNIEDKSFSGVAKIGNEVELSFRSNGIINLLDIKVGQKVKKGQLLARLDNVQARLAYEQALSSLKSAESNMNTAKSSLDKVRSLFEKGSKSLTDYESAKNQYESALSQYQSAQKSKSIQQSQIDYGVIRAPMSGTIVARHKELNENASPGQVVAVLSAGDKTNIEVGIPETYINKIKNGQEAHISFSALAGQDFKAEVIEVSPIISGNSAGYPVKLALSTASADIKAGMAATVNFKFSNNEKQTSKEVIRVPLSAVGEDGNGNYVFIIESSDNKTGVVKRQSIKVGQVSGTGIEVKEGLTSGQKLATAGLQTLLDGQKVSLE